MKMMLPVVPLTFSESSEHFGTLRVKLSLETFPAVVGASFVGVCQVTNSTFLLFFIKHISLKKPTHSSHAGTVI